ncbi:hypothetical protein N9878_01280 [bacterium]|nr:hypothetical protein [bacterium]
MAGNQSNYIPRPPQGGNYAKTNYAKTRYLDEPVLSAMAHRRIAASAYRHELSLLSPGASTNDVAEARKRADAIVESVGLTGSRTAQARENLKDTSGLMRSMMPLAVGTYGVFGAAVDALPGEAVTKAARDRGKDVLNEISLAGENRTAELLGSVGGALLDPITYTGYGALSKLGAASRVALAARGLARPTAGLAGRVAGEAAMGMAVETPVAYARGDKDPLMSGLIGGAVGGAIPLAGKALRGLRGKPDPYARNLPENRTLPEQRADTAKRILDDNRAGSSYERYAEQADAVQAIDIENKRILGAELGARKADALEVEAISSAANKRARSIAEDPTPTAKPVDERAGAILDDAADEVKVDKILDSPPATKAPDEARVDAVIDESNVYDEAINSKRLLDRADADELEALSVEGRQIKERAVGSEQTRKFNERLQKTREMRGEVSPVERLEADATGGKVLDEPTARPTPEPEIDVRTEMRAEALKDSGVVDEIEALESTGLYTREQAEALAMGDVPTAKVAPDAAPMKAPGKGASGDQIAMFQLNSGVPIDQMVGEAVKLGKWAKPHAIAGARWAMDTAGDAINTMRDFAQVVIDKFGRAIRKHVPEMWQRFKQMQATQSQLRQRTELRRQRGAIDLRDPNKGVPKTRANAIRANERAKMREVNSAQNQERRALRDSAVEAVEEKLGVGSPLLERAGKVESKRSLDSLLREVDKHVARKAESASVKAAKGEIAGVLRFDKKSGVAASQALDVGDFDSFSKQIEGFGISNPRNPTKRELALLSDDQRDELVGAYKQMSDAYTHTKKYGRRPYAEGADPLTSERKFVTEGWGHSIKRAWEAGGSALNAAIDPVSDSIRRMSPRMHGRLQSYVVGHHKLRHSYRGRIDPLMESVNKSLKKFPKDAKTRLTSAMSRGDADEVIRIADAMGEKGESVKALWTESRKVLNELYEMARGAGIDVGFLEDYWPRLVKKGRAEDLTSFFTNKPTNAITRGVKAKERQIGRALSEAERREVVEGVVSGRPPSTADGGRTGSLKTRQIGDIPDEAMHLYENFDTAMDSYIDRVTEAIKRKELFGKDVTLGSSGDDFFKFGNEAKIESIDDLGASIGTILDEDGVDPKNVGKMLETLRVLFNSTTTTTSGFTSNMRAFGYLSTMGQFRSALAQTEDIVSTAVFMPHQVPDLAKAFTQSVLGKADANMVQFGFDRIGEEFATKGGADKAVDLMFKTTGLSKLDAVLKNTTLQSAYLGGQRAAKTPGSKAFNRVRAEAVEKWGEESADQLMKDLADGNLDSDILATYVVEKLSGIQPLTSLDVPLGYHYAKQSWQGSKLAGFPVLAYQLKTFAFRRLGALRREGIDGMVEGVMMMKAGQKAEGAKKLFQATRKTAAMVTILTAAGATRQQVVGYLYGNESELSDDIGDSLLSLTGILNRYSAGQLQRSGPNFYSSVLAPPSVTTALDVITDGFRIADGKLPRSLRRIPHIQTLDIFARGNFTEMLRGGDKGDDVDTTPNLPPLPSLNPPR